VRSRASDRQWREPGWLARGRFPSFAEAVRTLPSGRAADRTGIYWTRLAYDEFLAGQLALALVRAHLRRPAGRATPGTGHLRKKLIEALPYSLTPSQTRAVAEIVADLEKPERMLRLLQGDVGSGKTVVALLAATAVIEAGRQAALMAPTELLARQHFNTIAPLADAIGIAVAILTGRERGRDRATILERLAAGDIQLLVGTHALVQDEVAFRDLALAVVDEQHRFGVQQRLALARKGEAVSVLVMTATPIAHPVLTYFGDMDVSGCAKSRPGASRSTTGRFRSAGSRRLVEGRPCAGRGSAGLLGVPAD
jgi:ATP-dependent DNA helicase RecG